MFNLKKYLWQKRMTKKELAAIAGISQPTLRLIEKGIPVSRIVAEKFSAAVGCSKNSLMNP
jgi:DNA-binding Xre family transcriptional regulator